jgi:hypothetical protein
MISCPKEEESKKRTEKEKEKRSSKKLRAMEKIKGYIID